jgi:hypothetical protein
MDIPRIVPQDIEYMTTYPVVGGRANERVLMVVLNTTENGRWLLYSPSVMQREMNVESSHDYQDYRDLRGNTILRRTIGREIVISNELYVLSNDNVAFKLISLDEQQKRIVKKEEIEKLFGCTIDG